jgi:hypothetical protein
MTVSPSRNTSRLPCDSRCTRSTSAFVKSAIVSGRLVGRSPPIMSGDRAITQSVSSETRSSGVSRSWRGSPRSARMPMRPRGSMSPSGHPDSDACGAHRANLAKFASTSSQRSQRSSQMRHMVACWRRCSTRVNERSRPGDRLSAIGRPLRSIARAYAAMSRSWYGQSMSSALMKSTPQSA